MWRFCIDPVGTSRFAPITPDISWDILPDAIKKVKTISPRLLRPNTPFSIHAHAEDVWGNVTTELSGLEFKLQISSNNGTVLEKDLSSSEKGWTNVIFKGLTLPTDGDYRALITLTRGTQTITTSTTHLSIYSTLSISKPLYADLHVHSDDIVGTHSSTYNFTYGREVSGLDVLGYTANDFQITAEKWESTLSLINSLNEPGKFVIYPGAEWCRNSAAGGDHNVVFLGDDDSEKTKPEFPVDKAGNVVRSFEWSEHGPKDLIPGAWPLDELYATYAHSPSTHLLIPHVGGRRCNLSWHHPGLENLVEIGSSWGHFGWLLRDALKRGYRVGVCANSDEHRGRCGGGVSGSAAFGTRGGLTGVLSENLTRGGVGKALRARRTFATNGERLVGLVSTEGGIQGDEVSVRKGSVSLAYHFLGDRGFSSLEAFDKTGCIWKRDFWAESPAPKRVFRVTWGGGRLYDRYREAIWNGTITLEDNLSIQKIVPFGGLEDNPEDYVRDLDGVLVFKSKTSGDFDGVNIHFEEDKLDDLKVSVKGSLSGYVKVGDPLAGNPHKPQPTFTLEATYHEALQPGGKTIEIKGGAELFVRIEGIPDIDLPTRVQGSVDIDVQGERAVYFAGTEWSGGKVVTSPIFFSV